MQKRWFILIGVAAFILVLGIGAVAGGAIAYFFLQDDVPAVFAAPDGSDSDEGVLISHVEEDSAAAKAGLERGDILLKVGDDAVNSFSDLWGAIKRYDPGDKLEMTVLHGDDLRTLTATLDERDDDPFLGVSTCDVPFAGEVMIDRGPFEFERDIEIHLGTGALVTHVFDDSPAEEAGIKAGDLILSVDGEEISSETDLADLIHAQEPGDRVTLEISRGKDEMTVEVELGENPDVSGQTYLGVSYQPFMPPMMFDFDGEEHFFFHDEPSMPFRDMPGLPMFENLPEGVENALIIGEVLDDSPAESAGLLEDDLIIYLDGKPVTDIEAFVDDIGSHDPGDTLTLTILRQDEEIEVVVMLGEHPEDPDKGYLGVRVAEFVKVKVEGEIPGDFEFDLHKELELPGGDA
jgi:S1-C subfamily serine protease